MSNTLVRVQELVARRAVRISDHGYDELDDDNILPNEILSGIHKAIVVEDYPEDARGLRVLVLQRDAGNRPVHVVWAIPTTQRAVAIVVTAYRPDPAQWSSDFVKRRKKP
jgi:hypothetical protein